MPVSLFHPIYIRLKAHDLWVDKFLISTVDIIPRNECIRVKRGGLARRGYGRTEAGFCGDIRVSNAMKTRLFSIIIVLLDGTNIAYQGPNVLTCLGNIWHTDCTYIL